MKTRFSKLFGFVFFLYFFSFAVAAKDIQVFLKLDSISVEKTSEKKGDELYFSFTQYSNLNHAKTGRMPEFPTHWLSQHIAQLKNVPLWQVTLKEGEEIKLIISLGEQDNPPWDPDEELGSAELILKNKQGNLEKIWTEPVFEELNEVEKLPSSSDTVQRYIFKGEGSHYTISFSIEQK